MPTSATFLSNSYGNPRYVKKAVKALGNVRIKTYLAGNFYFRLIISFGIVI